MQMRKRTYPGTVSAEPTELERTNRALSRAAAADGMVLLKNEGGMLPLASGTQLALYGWGAVRTVKGGTGSGDVNERETVSIFTGLEQAGFEIVNREDVLAMETDYDASRLAWRDDILARTGEDHDGFKFFDVYSSTVFQPPLSRRPRPEWRSAAAVCVISRVAGEGHDRKNECGDYLPDLAELGMIAGACCQHKQVILVINSAAVMDLSFLDDFPQITAVILMGQAGMEGGTALADVLSGTVNPSGRLTDTWALSYADYPSAADFTSGNLRDKYYTEGIYVGYRYFDTFQKPVRYGFGYGLSYTDFDISYCGAEARGQHIAVSVSVTNTGSAAGREVVQLYVSCPQTELAKEYRRLAGFAKTRLLAPGQTQNLTVCIPYYALASFSEKCSAWLLEEGSYVLWCGSSLAESKKSAVMRLNAAVIMSETKLICPLDTPMDELRSDASALGARLGDCSALPILDLSADRILPVTAETPVHSAECLRLADSLTQEQMISLLAGDPAKSQNSVDLSPYDGIMLPGAAAETSLCAESNGLACIVLADGPAGLRVNRFYDTDEAGRILRTGLRGSFEGGFFAEPRPDTGHRRYQYCTAFPVGALLAQTWDRALISAVGRAVGAELQAFDVTLWLAPGMNIHRDPLCGRNFEYYSEDPLLTGLCAAAMTAGVQSVPGVGTTVKHFAANSCEDNRMNSCSHLSERALREIYLRGFEIAIRDSQPMAIMTSYNLINGVHTANSYDLCTEAARNEWGFAGVIMTDWGTTVNSEPDRPCTASGCIAAGNDLIMPGNPLDFAGIRKALADGTLSAQQLRAAVENIAEIVLASLMYESAEPYADRFAGLGGFMTAE